MRLEELCVFEWRYDAEGRLPDGGLVVIRPYGGEEGSAYGEGSGTVRGERITGTVSWSNHPHRRSDGRMLPDVHGLIVTDDDARIVFELRGRTVFDAAGNRGAQSLIGIFESADSRYAWLNDVVCVAEGQIVFESNRIEIHVYEAVNELVE
ncbi:MAG TPA: DUF3237 family protein [Solirubrobacteraceae bacterium]|nr:DUF3237 family protein [Solirubrobacteraceae bacterium]